MGESPLASSSRIRLPFLNAGLASTKCLRSYPLAKRELLIAPRPSNAVARQSSSLLHTHIALAMHQFTVGEVVTCNLQDFMSGMEDLWGATMKLDKA